jgi:hypothetical protein
LRIYISVPALAGKQISQAWRITDSRLTGGQKEEAKSTMSIARAIIEISPPEALLAALYLVVTE